MSAHEILNRPGKMTDSTHLRWWSSPRTLLRHILMLDDTPHSVALGTAIGMFIAMTPTVGIQMILVIVFGFLTARLFRFNRVAALIAVYVSNPATIVPIYYLDYKVGTLFVEGNYTRGDFVRILEYHSFSEWKETMVSLLFDVGTPLVLGSLLVAAVCAAMTYPAILMLIKSAGRAAPLRPAAPDKVPASTAPDRELLPATAEVPADPQADAESPHSQAAKQDPD